MCNEYFSTKLDLLQHEVKKHLIIYCPFCKENTKTKFTAQYISVNNMFENHVQQDHPFISFTEMKSVYNSIKEFIYSKDLCSSCNEYVNISVFDKSKKICHNCCKFNIIADELTNQYTKLTISPKNIDCIDHSIISEVTTMYSQMDLNKDIIIDIKNVDGMDDDIIEQLSSQYKQKMTI